MPPGGWQQRPNVPAEPVYRLCDAMRRCAFPLLLVLGCLPACLPGRLALAQTPRGVDIRPEFEDAELADVYFVDSENGWAVGDRGVIWHTDNGGRAWHLQPSGVGCRLTSVYFLDAKQGWAGGGAALPPGDLSRGVVLHTRDGGQTWQPIPRLSLPAINRLRFFDASNGWCLGEPSGLYPSGIAMTTDGGRTWDPLPGEGRRGWLTGDLLDPKTGALAGAVGALAPIRRRAIEAGASPGFGLRSIHALRLASNGHGWLVGDAGLALSTRDGGRNWAIPEGELPAVASQFEWRTVSATGNNVWIAGTPGSHVLHSSDGGQSWSLRATRQALPIQALHFVDATQGYAVGAMGTILFTQDGGQSWRAQRAGGRRAAWLAILSEPAQLPWEVWGKLAAGDGYLGAALFIGRRDTAEDSPAEIFRAARGRQALIELGATATEHAWRFPLRPRGLATSASQILGDWNTATDGRAMELLEAELVRSVRTWRPDVVLTHAAFPRGDHPLEHLVNQAVLRAVEAAADPARHSLQISQQGLAPWQVKKVIGGPVASQQDTIRLQSNELVPRLCESLAELAESPRMLLNEPARPANQELAFRLYSDKLPQKAGSKDFFAGIVLQPGGEARRRPSAPDPATLERRQQLAVRTRNLQAILDRTTVGGRGGVEVVGAIGGLVGDLDGPLAGRVLYRLAQDYVRHGEWELAAQTMQLLPERYPQHPLAPVALVWQVGYGASSEIAWRLNKGERLVSERTRPAEPGNLSGQPAEPQPRDPRKGVVAASLVERADRITIDHQKHDHAAEHAVAAAKQLEQLDPARAREPAVVLPLARAYRGRGLHHDADKLLVLLKQNRAHDAWWTCAAGELWLGRPEGVCPKPTTVCSRAATRPRLDGVLDDAVWQKGLRVDLTSGDNEDAPWPAAGLLAYDSEFLYLAVACRRAPSVNYAQDGAARPRDADLSQRDRVELLLDIDRDTATWYRLSIDARGWTNDSCGDDAHWNPQWFVAVDETDGDWTVEAAIPFEQLTRDYPRSKSAWSIGLQRIVPGMGFQSWTKPAAPTGVPQGFGYLLFE